MASGGPNDAKNLHFTASSSTAEDLLKNQTVGLVQLSDFRKRRAEVLDQRDRDAQNNSLSRTGTPDPASTDVPRNRFVGLLGDGADVNVPSAVHLHDQEIGRRRRSRKSCRSVCKTSTMILIPHPCSERQGRLRP